MAINTYSLDGYTAGTGNIEDLDGTTVNLSNWNDTTFQWSDDTLGPGDAPTQVQDLDTVGLLDTNLTTPPVNEGVLVNGTLFQVQTFVAFHNTEIKFADGSTLNMSLSGIELTNGMRIIQFSDAQITQMENQGYNRYQIAQIKLGTSEFIRTRAARNFDSAFALCFTNGTTILTDQGLCAVEDLRPGDRIATKNNDLRTVAWIGRSQYDTATLAKHKALLPICIQASALAPNVPDRDLVVSRQHRIYVESAIAKRMFGSSGVLIAAKDLLDHPGVRQMQASECGQGVNYIHVLLDRHDIMIANGAPAESLLLAEQALEAVGPAARSELRDFLERPEVLKAASPIIRGQAARNLVARHLRNDKPLVSPADNMCPA